MNTRILLLGSGGQLGNELSKKIRTLGLIKSCDRNTCDLDNFKEVETIINDFKPEIIVNAAAYTKVDEAEENTSLAFRINQKAIEFLSEISLKRKIWFIHYSTDYVFDGKKKNSYKESDKTNPLNIYGQSKLGGEEALKRSKCNFIIFRTTWVYGEHGLNFIKTIKKLACNNDCLNIINDQLGVPTSTKLICKVTMSLIKDIIKKNYWDIGIYNLVPNGLSNWYELAKLIAYIGREEMNLDEFKHLKINPIPSSNYKTAAKRPLNSQLDNNKLQKKLKFQIPNWKDEFISTTLKILG